MEYSIGIEDIIGVIRRRWFLPLITIAIGLPIGLVVAYSIPPVYQASASILVESQQIPTDLVRSTVEQSTQERITLIQQRLFTRQTLLELAERYQVFADRPQMSATEIVAEMRASASVVGSTARGRARNVTGIDVRFRARNPDIAARVANDLVDRVIAENAEARTLRATGTRAFFDQEVSRLTAEIEALSAQVTQFKIENADSLPDSLVVRQSALSGLRERVFDRELQIASLLEQRRNLVAVRDAGQTSLPSSRTRTPEEIELSRLKAQLLIQRATLAETHPIIRQLDARIAALETSARNAATPEPDPASQETANRTPVETQIATIDFQIGQLEVENNVNRDRMAALEQSIEATPQIERLLSRLEGNLSVLQTQLREATLKRAEAETGERLEASQQAERFEVVEQAIPINTPISPRRPRIIAASVAVSGAIGVGLMILLELLNPAIRSVYDLEKRAGLRPIVAIPHIRSEAEGRQRRLLLRGLIAVAVLVSIGAIIAVDQLILPLPILFERVVSAARIGPLLQAIGLPF